MTNNPLGFADDRVLVEQLRLIMGNFRSSWVIIIVTILLVAALSDGENDTALWLWGAAAILSNLNLHRHVLHHLKAGIAPGLARRRTVVLGMLHGLDGAVWGGLPWLTLGTADLTGFVLVMGAFSGMLGAGMATHSPIPAVFLFFTLPQAVGMVSRLWTLEPPQTVLGVMAILYFISLIGQMQNSARAARMAIDLRFELADSHARLREIEHRQTLAQERQRLVQDMHDGLGSSLVGALRAVERGHLDEAEIARILQSCIDDLKLAIDSLEPVDADLLLLLATLRFRLGARMQSSGIALLWQVTDVPALDWLDPRNALHILRILQETFSNIIKHTAATEVRVATRVEDDHVVVSVTDNGPGFVLQDGLRRGGKGLSGQMRRAQAIGADIAWTPQEQGTCVALRLPIRR